MGSEALASPQPAAAGLIYRTLFSRRIKGLLERIPYIRRIYAGWMRVHPIDRRYGTDTSGFVPVEQIHPDPALNKLIIVYAGSQPSIVRRAISTIPGPQERAFVDIGCGKGRATIVASEFPFRQITGVELSPDLVKIAQANVAKVKAAFPDRSPISVTQGNAIEFQLPPGKVVVFMYHPFGRELMTKMVQSLEAQLKQQVEQLFVIYNNPVHGELFDTSPAFKRWFAEVVPYDSSEAGYGPDLEETVVVWQSATGALASPHPGADRPIVTIKPLWTAGLG